MTTVLSLIPHLQISSRSTIAAALSVVSAIPCFHSILSCFSVLSSAGFGSNRETAGPAPISDPIPKETHPKLPKVKSPRHVYPLSYLSYFEDSKPRLSPRLGSNGAKLH